RPVERTPLLSRFLADQAAHPAGPVRRDVVQPERHELGGQIRLDPQGRRLASRVKGAGARRVRRASVAVGRWTDDLYGRLGFGMWAVVENASGSVLGYCGLSRFPGRCAVTASSSSRPLKTWPAITSASRSRYKSQPKGGARRTWR